MRYLINLFMFLSLLIQGCGEESSTTTSQINPQNSDITTQSNRQNIGVISDLQETVNKKAINPPDLPIALPTEQLKNM